MVPPDLDYNPYHAWRESRLDWLENVPRVFGDNGEHNKIGGLIDLIKYTQPKTVLEIGSHRGVSTEVFLLFCQRVVAVDAWEDNFEYGQMIPWSGWKQQFDDRTKDFPNLEVVQGQSPEILSFFSEGEFDLVYIDGNHSKESVLKDIGAARRLTKKWLAGHDYNQVKEYLPFKPEETFKDQSWCIRIQT